MNRKQGRLIPLEMQILESVIDLQSEGQSAYGFTLAKAIAGRAGSSTLTSHGTLYKALGRLAKAGLVESSWEDPAEAERSGRPRRRLYGVTGVGEAAVAREHAHSQVPARLRPAAQVSPA